MISAALEVLRQAVGSIGDDQLGRQTPCRDYDVAALATHVIDSITRISAAAGVVVPEPADAPIPRQVLETARAVQVGWERRGFDGDVHFGGRSLPARDLLGIIALEFVVHGWDFATAVGAVLDVPEALAEELLRLARRTVTAESRRSAGFDEPIARDADASSRDRLLAFTGRDPAARTLLL